MVTAPFIHFVLVLLSKIVFCVVQKQKGKHIFKKKWYYMYIVSPMVQKLNSVNFINSGCKQSMFSNICHKNQYRQATGKFEFSKHFLPNFFPCVYILCCYTPRLC